MKPILVIQMQRMGDLIMTFPLLLWLKRRFPGQEIVVVADPHFYTDLAPIGPGVVYVPSSHDHLILEREYSLVINVSHRREGAGLAGKVRAEEKIGPYLDAAGHLYIQGNWQLYRASLVDCNQHNTFHWAELNALDIIAPEEIQQTRWSVPREFPGHNPKVGIFLGASQPEKRPLVSFWGELARGLLDKGMRPILLGGPGEVELGNEVQQSLDVSVLNLAGKTTLAELACIGQTVQLMITPDTGPMHLAAWTGLRVLNLSMGPVNPWETGPYQGGHYILETTLPCAGCWTCQFDKPRCIRLFNAPKIVRLVDEIIRHREHNLAKMTFPDLSLLRSSRCQGLYWLDRVSSSPDPLSDRQMLNRFWHGVWKWHFGVGSEEEARQGALEVVSSLPDIAGQMRLSLLDHCRMLAVRSGNVFLEDMFQDEHALPALAPCVRFARLVLENGNFSRPARLSVLALCERILSLLS